MKIVTDVENGGKIEGEMKFVAFRDLDALCDGNGDDT
jgi:hypothetical protein